MNIKIRNLAKIASADIDINGITVIVGKNNTGKSTIGKALFSIFNSVHDINSKVYGSRKNELLRRYRIEIRRFFQQGEEDARRISQGYTYPRNTEMIFRKLIHEFRRDNCDIEDVDAISELIITEAEKMGIHIGENEKNDFEESLQSQKELVSEIADYDISLEIIERFFRGVFSEQVCSLNNDVESEICINIHGAEQRFKFIDNRCIEWKNSFEILHEAFLIDNPFIMDNLNEYHGSNTMQNARDFLLSKIQLLENDIEENIISAVMAKEKLKDIELLINNIVSDTVRNKNGEWVVFSNNFTEDIHLNNLSAGVKSFLLIKLLLEKGILNEKDVLVLDEPEIHLHPEWQIKYAEMIVLLQKMFDLSILVTTHSRDFFEAINLYSKKYDVENNCRYYLSKEMEDGIEFINVTDNNSEVYRQLIEPSQLLDKLKFELEEYNE